MNANDSGINEGGGRVTVAVESINPRWSCCTAVI